MRWMSRLAQFEFTIKNRSDKMNKNAGALSRRPNSVEDSETIIQPVTNTSVLFDNFCDKNLHNVKTCSVRIEQAESPRCYLDSFLQIWHR